MWPVCYANNPIWLLLPFVIGLATAWWAWSGLRKQQLAAPTMRRRRTSRRLRKARRTMDYSVAGFTPAEVSEARPDQYDTSRLANDFDLIAVAPSAPVLQRLESETEERQHPGVADVQSGLAAAPDNLLLIKGIGPSLNAMLASLGITRFAQIAEWREADVAEIDSHLGAFSGRISRENWIEQAQLLATGRMDEFERRFGNEES